MLSKTVRFEDDVLSVIQAMQWEDDGRLGILTGGQLERNLYTRVNKALETMGGKWNRKAGGHLFASDPRAQVEGLLGNGALTVERDGFFETPAAVVSRMLQFVPVSSDCRILEPSAGCGAIANRLPVLRSQVVCVEKNAERCQKLQGHGFEHVHCADFLHFTDGIGIFDRVYMNPPFEASQDIEHVRHAFGFLKPGGSMVSVMGEGAFFRQDKRAREFREWLESVGGYSDRLPQWSFRESGTDVAARLAIIVRG